VSVSLEMYDWRKDIDQAFVAELESRRLTEDDSKKSSPHDAVKGLSSVNEPRPMIDDIEIDFDIAEATETILPCITNNEADLLSGLKTTTATASAHSSSVPFVSCGDAAGLEQGPHSFDGSAGSSPTDAAFAMVGLGVEEPLPPQEVQNEL
jgi:hypothetical protein